MNLEKPQRNPEVGHNERGGRKRKEERRMGREGTKAENECRQKRKSVKRYIEVLLDDLQYSPPSIST